MCDHLVPFPSVSVPLSSEILLIASFKRPGLILSLKKPLAVLAAECWMNNSRTCSASVQPTQPAKSEMTRRKRVSPENNLQNDSIHGQRALTANHQKVKVGSLLQIDQPFNIVESHSLCSEPLLMFATCGRFNTCLSLTPAFSFCDITVYFIHPWLHESYLQ